MQWSVKPERKAWAGEDGPGSSGRQLVPSALMEREDSMPAQGPYCNATKHQTSVVSFPKSSDDFGRSLTQWTPVDRRLLPRPSECFGRRRSGKLQPLEVGKKLTWSPWLFYNDPSTTNMSSQSVAPGPFRATAVVGAKITSRLDLRAPGQNRSTAL